MTTLKTSHHNFSHEKKELKRLNDFLNSLSGRDKFTKWLQFTTKLAAYYLVSGQHKELSKRLNDLAVDLSQCRKGFRILKTLGEVDKFFEALESKKDLMLKIFKVAMAMLYAVYWYYDSKAYLAKAKFLPNLNLSVINVTASKWLLWALLCQLVIEFTLIHRLHETRRKEKEEEEDPTQTNVQLLERHLTLITVLGDLVVCINQTLYDKALFGRPFNEGFVTFCGFFSSVVGVYLVYPSSK